MNVKGRYSVKSLWGGASNPRRPGRRVRGCGRLGPWDSLASTLPWSGETRGHPRHDRGSSEARSPRPAGPTHTHSPRQLHHRAVPQPPRPTVTAPKAPALPGSNSDSAGSCGPTAAGKPGLKPRPGLKTPPHEESSRLTTPPGPSYRSCFRRGEKMGREEAVIPPLGKIQLL